MYGHESLGEWWEHAAVIASVPYLRWALALAMAMLLGAVALEDNLKKTMRNNSEVYKTVEGNFNGEDMAGDDGRLYPVPGNYASKSRLVQGDRLKMEVFADGGVFFKQISPIERVRFIGRVKALRGKLVVDRDGQPYQVNQASLAWYRLGPGDEVVALTSEGASWCAIDQKISGIPAEASEVELDLG